MVRMLNGFMAGFDGVSAGGVKHQWLSRIPNELFSLAHSLCQNPATCPFFSSLHHYHTGSIACLYSLLCEYNLLHVDSSKSSLSIGV